MYTVSKPMWTLKRIQHSALSLVPIEKFKEAIDTSNKIGALLTDFLKALDCLDHSLLDTKLHWHGLLPLSLKLTFSYFGNRTHPTNLKECFSNRIKIEYVVPQRPILGTLVFNVNLIDMILKTLTLKTMLRIQLHTLALPTLIQLFLNYK